MIVSKRLDEAEATYSRLLEQRTTKQRAADDVARRLTTLIREEPVVELRTKSQRLFFVSRWMSEAGLVYRVFPTELSAIIGEEPIGFCDIVMLTNGVCVISNAEVSRSYQCKGIASAVYDLITADMSNVGGLLWPVSPKKMSDAEFKVWWRRSPALVFYYPHRTRLGFSRRPEFEELFDETVNLGGWDRLLSYCSMLMARIRRSSGLG
ncbi:MAG: GNAT family N-acetyltransferase [Proteobacteria bacterium]|nr:GNAT family N-acetyltransferase [Pseudomonadota bacterium]